MGKVRLKDIDCFISDGNYSSKYPRSGEFVKEGIPFIRCNNFKNNTITKEDMYYITKEKHSILQKGHLRQGDILITTRGSLGQVVIVPKEYEDANINAQIVLLRVNKEKIYNRYLMWQLKSENIQNQIMKNKTGTALPQLPISKLEKIELFIVDNIQEQIEIATKLDKIQEIIDIRKKQIEELDKLIKSQFVEMFGNVNDNKNSYEIKTLSEVFEFIKDGTHSTPTYTDDKINGIKFLSAKDVTKGIINWENIKYIPLELHEQLVKRVKPQKDDILLAKNGTTGVCAKVDRDEIFDIYVSLALLRPKEGYLVDYLVQAINNDMTKEQFDRSLKGVGVPNLHLGEIQKVKIIVPPIELQNKFADIVKQIDKQKFEIQKNLEEMQKLQESLMNKYFG